MKKTKPAVLDAKVRIVLLPIPCVNEPEDERKKGMELSQLSDDLDAVDVEKVEACEEFKKQRMVIVLRMRSLRDEIRQGFEKRMVECAEEFDFETGVVTVLRTDTDAVFLRREMTNEERQLALELDEPKQVTIEGPKVDLLAPIVKELEEMKETAKLDAAKLE